MNELPFATLEVTDGWVDINGDYRTYWYRWVMLGIFSCLTVSNAIIWISFAPIDKTASGYFDLSVTMIAFIAVLFQIFYLPGSILSTPILHKYGLRIGLCVGAVLNFLGAMLRFLSIGDYDGIECNGQGKLWIFAGTTLAALAQPFFTNLPARIAGEWFPVAQRDLATVLGSMFNPIGIAIGQVLPTVIVHESTRKGIPKLLLIEMIIAGAVLLLAVLFFQSAPPTPPSRSSAQRRLMPSDRSVHDMFRHLWAEVVQIMTEKNFLILFISFGMGLGLFNAITTLISDLVRPMDYHDDDAGMFGGLIIGCGLVGSAIAGPLMDAAHIYNPLLKVGFILCTIFTGSTLLLLQPNSLTVVSIMFGILGFFMLPLLPVAFECGVECTFPVHEETSSGLLMVSGQMFGIGFVFLYKYLIDLNSEYSTVWTASNLAIGLSVLTACIIMQFYDGPYKRLEQETALSCNTDELLEEFDDENEHDSMEVIQF